MTEPRCERCDARLQRYEAVPEVEAWECPNHRHWIFCRSYQDAIKLRDEAEARWHNIFVTFDTEYIYDSFGIAAS